MPRGTARLALRRRQQPAPDELAQARVAVLEDEARHAPAAVGHAEGRIVLAARAALVAPGALEGLDQPHDVLALELRVQRELPLVLLHAVHELDHHLAVGARVDREQRRAAAEVDLAPEAEALPEEPLARPAER